MARASAAARGIPSATCREPIDGPLCEFGLAWFTGKRRAVIDPQPPRQPYPCRHPYPRIIAARHYLGFPGKARSALPLLSPSEVDPPASARAERPPFDTFTATTRDATRNEDPPPPGLRPVWVKLRRISIIPAFPVNLQRRNAYRQADTAGEYQFQKCGLPEVTFSAAPHDAVAPQVRSPHRPGPMDIPSSQTGQATFATVRA